MTNASVRISLLLISALAPEETPFKPSPFDTSHPREQKW